MLTRTPALLAIFLTAAGGCSSPPVADQAQLAGLGSYAIGTRDYVFVDPTRPTPRNGIYPGDPARTLKTRVWYPAAADGTSVAAGGPFPLLAYAHGFTANGASGRYFGEHLASHGYIVAAPDFPLTNGAAPGGPTLMDLPEQPGDLAFVLSQVAALSGADAALGQAVDKTRQGLFGLSLGGATVLMAAYHPTLHLPEGMVRVAAAQAPLSCLFGGGFYSRALPMLILSGDADEIVPTQSGPARAFMLAMPPVGLLTLHGGTHTGFVGLDPSGTSMNADDLGCIVLNAGGGAGQLNALAAALSQGNPAGVIDDSPCGSKLCPVEKPQTMTSSRQIDLSRAAMLAHFESILRHDDAAARFLSHSLAQDNTDVSYQAR